MISIRGIQNATAYMVNIGLAYPVTYRYLRHESKSISIKNIEKLCIALNCTPNDLFEWKPDADAVVPENHSLHQLGKVGEAKTLRQLVKDIPSDKLKLVENFLEELKK